MSGIKATTQSLAAARPATAVGAGYRLTLAIIGLYTVATLALLTVAARPGPVIPGFSAFFAAGVFVTETATAFLLFVRFRDDRTWSLLVLACGYLFSGAMAMPYLLAFPGALLRDASVIGSSQTIAWIFLAWIFGFAVLTFVAAVLEARVLPPIATRDVSRLIGTGVLCVLATVVAIVAIAVGAADWLPQQVGPTGWTAWDTVISFVNMALLVASLLVILVVIRGRNEIFLWVALALTAMLFGNVLSTYGGGRFTIGWSFSRLNWVFSGCALFLYFMGQFVRQQRLLGKTRDALEQRVGERTADLTNMISQRDLLLREVHHRVKNNFQVINSLISFESSHAANEETRETLRNLHGRVYALGLVHQRLMQSSDLATFDIRAFLDDLCANLGVAIVGRYTRHQIDRAGRPAAGRSRFRRPARATGHRTGDRRIRTFRRRPHRRDQRQLAAHDRHAPRAHRQGRRTAGCGRCRPVTHRARARRPGRRRTHADARRRHDRDDHAPQSRRLTGIYPAEQGTKCRFP